MKKVCKEALCALSLLLCASSICGQHRLTGKVVSSEREPVSAVVSLHAADNLVGATVADEKGEFAFDNLAPGVYRLTVMEPRFQPVTDSLSVFAGMNRNYTLFPIATVSLEEVVVTANRSNLVRQTSSGAIFHFSSMAKSKTDVFDALTEIPGLVVNPSERSIRLNNGSVPLILVNGIQSPNGVSHLDPADIESVEVIQVPSARYLGETESVLNVKVARKQYAYYAADVLSRQPLSGLYGYSSAGLETGGPKYMLYATGQHFYFHNAATSITSTQENTAYRKESDAAGNYNSQQYSAALGGDYVFSGKDYLSYSLTYASNPSRTDREGRGFYTAGGMPEAFRLSGCSENKFYINTYNIYHAHTFGGLSKLETTLRFNLNSNQTSTEQTEAYATRDDYRYSYRYDNFRYSSSLDVNYSFPSGEHAVNIGSRSNFRNDRIEMIASPVFHYREWKEYLYADASGPLGSSVSYMISAGADAISSQSAGVENAYLAWASSASLLYRPAPGNSMRLSYQKANSAPDISYLNPYNTSADTLYQMVGNPNLRPIRRHHFLYEYTFNRQGIYLAPQIRYTLVEDNILPTGANTGNVYTQTYVNDDRFSELNAQMALRYNTSWGSLGGSLGYRHTYYAEVDRGTFFSNINANVYYRRFSANIYLMYQRYSYDPFLVSENLTPECELTANWRLNSTVSLLGGLRYFLGMIRSESTMENAGYRAFSHQDMTNRRFMFSLGVSINLRNKIQKNRTDKRLYQNEQGISLPNAFPLS